MVAFFVALVLQNYCPRLSQSDSFGITRMTEHDDCIATNYALQMRTSLHPRFKQGR
jgi:hypothetical protein